MKALLLVVIMLGGVVFIACDPGIGITIENQTGVPVCSDHTQRGRPAPDPARACSELVTDPHDTTRHGVICLPDYIVHLVVTRQDTGEVLYSSDATCGDWDDSGAKISIIEIDGRIEARASLDDEE